MRRRAQPARGGRASQTLSDQAVPIGRRGERAAAVTGGHMAKETVKQEAALYIRKVFYSQEDQCWVAVAPEIPGCSAFGKSDAEALKELDDAIEGHLAVRREQGLSLPKPISAESLGGRFLLRLPKALQRTLKEEATEEGVSVNQYALFLFSTARAQRHPVKA